MQLSLSARYFNLAVNNAWRAASTESMEGGMHGWDDSCVTEDGSRRCKTLTGIYVQNEPAASRKYAVNVNGHFPETPADISVTESCAGRVQTSPREADRSPRYKKRESAFNAKGQRRQLSSDHRTVYLLTQRPFSLLKVIN